MPDEILKVCHDRVLSAREEYEAAELGKEEREGNTPRDTKLEGFIERLDQLPGSLQVHTDEIRRASLVMLTGSRIKNGRTILIYFMDGPEWARARAFEIFQRWSIQANIRLVRTTDRLASDWRITFAPGPSWCYLGNQCFVIDKDQPTMQLGWLLRMPDDIEEWVRVCLHEAGHGFDFGHEQAHPSRTFEWNKPAVYAEYSGPPNNWSQRQIDYQVLFQYSELRTNFSAYDKFSVMHYAIPAELVLDPADAVPWNSYRSRTDKRYAALWYPKDSTIAAIERIVDDLELAA
jgi:serralysin